MGLPLESGSASPRHSISTIHFTSSDCGPRIVFSFFSLLEPIFCWARYNKLSHCFWLFLENRFVGSELWGQTMTVPKAPKACVWIAFSRGCSNWHPHYQCIRERGSHHTLDGPCIPFIMLPNWWVALCWLKILKTLEYFILFLSFCDGSDSSVQKYAPCH